METENKQLHRQLLTATWLIAGLLFFFGLGDVALLSQNEARRALPIESMFQSGDWLLPRLNGELYLTKPPLLYWLAAGLAHLTGSVNEWVVRFPSALAAMAIAVVCYRYAVKRFGAWAALFMLQVLIANVSFAMFARRAEIEMLLSALCVGALLAAFHYKYRGGAYRWLLLSFLLQGAAMLCKGPVVLVCVTLPLFVDALRLGQPRHWRAALDPLGWALFLGLGLSWYGVVSWQLGPEVWMATAQKDLLAKAYGASGEPPYNYLIWLLSEFFPASLLLFAAPLAVWRKWKVDSETVGLVMACLLPFVVFSMASDKHAKYLLPIYPLLALLLGKRLGEIHAAARLGLKRTLVVLGLLLPLGYAGYFAVFEARLLDYRVAAFPAFKAWLAETGGMPVSAYVDIDERTVYYAQRQIPIVNPDGLPALRASRAPQLLLVEQSRIDEVRGQADCLIREFSPYLKKGRRLVVFGFGQACPLATKPAAVVQGKKVSIIRATSAG